MHYGQNERVDFMKNLQDLQGKTAFITGAASGIGLGIAKVCAKYGTNVIIADSRQDGIDDAMQFFKENNYPAHGIKLDVTDREAYEKAADEAERVFGNIHLLINNAGIGARRSLLYEATFSDWDYIVGVNVTGVFNGIKIIVPRMLRHGESGHIVTTSSTGGASAVNNVGLYCMSKFAVSGLTETLAADLQGTNLGASVFLPGPINSSLTVTTYQNRPEHLKDESFLADKPPTGSHAEFIDIFMDPIEGGERLLRGVIRGDLFIWTHKEFERGIKARCDAIIRAFPDEPVNEARAEALKAFNTLTYNPIYDAQTTPGAPDWD